jgi:hypothetical protein
MGSNYVKNKTGVPPDTMCQICGITAEQSVKKGPVETGINHPEYSETYSFFTDSQNKTGLYMCPRCHRENSVKKLFDFMDKRDKK